MRYGMSLARDPPKHRVSKERIRLVLVFTIVDTFGQSYDL
jgi:hypothetical protein